MLQFIGVVAMLYLPSLNADIIDNGIATGDTAYILHTGGVMLAVSLVQIVCAVTAVWFGARTAMGFGRDLRRELFHRVGSFSTREVQQFGAPSLITRTTNDVQQVQMLVLMGCTMAVSAPIMMVGGVLMALREDIGPRLDPRRRGAGAVPHASASWSAGWCRASGRCRAGSTRSTGCCASRSPASAWSAPSSASRTSSERFGQAQRRPRPTSR